MFSPAANLRLCHLPVELDVSLISSNPSLFHLAVELDVGCAHCVQLSLSVKSGKRFHNGWCLLVKATWLQLQGYRCVVTDAWLQLRGYSCRVTACGILSHLLCTRPYLFGKDEKRFCGVASWYGHSLVLLTTWNICTFIWKVHFSVRAMILLEYFWMCHKTRLTHIKMRKP